MLQQIITQQIRAHGTLTVHDYMQLCLQHPEYGYYRKAQAVGKDGDFITAPEISQVFGDLLGMWLIHAWQVSGMPKLAALVELGPGRGTLSADIMRIIKKNKTVEEVFTLHLVESNPTLRNQQSQKLWRHQPQWHDSLTTLPSDLPLFFIANEFFDALPIRQFVGEAERCVTLQNEALRFVPEGDVTKEDCPQAEEIMRLLAERLKQQGGCALIIDYGYVKNQESRIRNQALETSRFQIPDSKFQTGDTLQAIKNHHYHPILQDPGEADLTAHVDFTALAAIAQECGLHVHGPVEQGTFLQRIGGDLWLQKLLAKAKTPAERKSLEEGWLRLVSPLQMGTLFKVMALTPHACELAGLR